MAESAGLRSRGRRREVTIEAEAEAEKPSSSTRRSVQRLFLPTLVAFLTMHVVVFAVATYFHHRLPTPALDRDTPPALFSEERAWAHLSELESFGVRNVGSEANEVLAPKYIVAQLEAFKKAAPPGAQIEFEVQRASGCFHLDFLEPFTSCYQDVANILARLSFPTAYPSNNRSSILLSSHYDSAPQVPAASDDLSNIAMMLEVLRALSHGPALQHDILFNFNGAEETILQASHGFITQHPWAKSIRVFLNFESAGGGGRALLFQVGPKHGWLLKDYAEAVPRPNGNSIAQDIFQSGIYRDFGALPGMDYAYIGNGYHYHTRRDDVAHFDRGSIQHGGDNALALLRHIGHSALVPNPGEEAKSEMVFFDFLGLLMVTYPVPNGALFNWAVIAFALAYYYYKGLLTRDAFVSAGAFVVVVLGTFLVAALIGLTLNLVGRSMVWYSNPHLLYVLYLPLLLNGFLFFQSKLQPQGDSPSIMSVFINVDWFVGVQLFWVAMLSLLNALSFGSAYFPLLFVLWPTLGFIVASHLPQVPHVVPLAALTSSIALPTLYGNQMTAMTLSFFTPLMGRVGNVPVDIIIGIVTAFFICVLLSVSTSYHGVAENKRLRNFLFVVAAIFFFQSFFMSPYDYEHPKRLAGFHITREFHNGTSFYSDSGIWTLAFDYLGMEAIRVPYLAELEHHKPGCYGLYCDLPFFFPVRDIYAAERLSWYSPSAPPPLPFQPKLEILNTTFNATANTRRIFARILGSDHNALFIESHSKLKAWSFLPFIPPHERESYFVFFASSHRSATWDFWLDIEGKEVIELAYSSHFMDLHTAEMRRYRNRLPSYVDALTWSAYWARWTI